MIEKLFFVALLSAAFAAPQTGHFSAEDPLFSMVEELSKSISQASQTIGEAAEEHTGMASGVEAGLQQRCKETREVLSKAVKETIAKGIQKNETLEAFGCISSKAREGLEKVDAIEAQMRKDMKNILEKYVQKLKVFQLSMKHLHECVEDFYIAKIEEMNKPGSDTNKILGEAKKKLASLESKLKDIEKKLKASKENLSKELNGYGFSIVVTLWNTKNDQSAKIRKCVR